MSMPANETPPLIARSGRPMATDISVQIAAGPEQQSAASAAADACMAWFDEVDERLSRFRPQSELSQLNRRAGAWFAASDTLFEAVAIALWAARASDGLFDPTLLRQIEALGYDRDFALIAQREVQASATIPPALAATPSLGAWRAIELDARHRRIRLPPGVALDLGGIAKGWAADVALSRFCAPFAGALVNVGGDLRAQGGPAPGEPWRVGLRDPRDELLVGAAGSPTYVGAVSLSRGGLATSGAVRRWWLRQGVRQHHLLDPRTGQPIPLWIDGQERSGAAPDAASLIATATALAPTAARAEVAAKVALLRGHPQALRTVGSAWARFGAVAPDTSADADADAGVALILTLGSGEVVTSQNLPAYLASWGTAGASLPMLVPGPSHARPKGG